MIGVAVTMVMSAVAFQLFQQSDEVFRDQNQTLAMQQNVRATASQIANDLRVAGQNVPIFSSRFDSAPAEAVQTILSGSNGTEIRFRSGRTNVNSVVTSPATYPLGVVTTINASNVAPFDAAIGGGAGRFVYIVGKTPNLYGWVRAEVISVQTGPNTMVVRPYQVGSLGSNFVGAMTVALEEGISYRLDGNIIRRGVVSDFTDLTTPTIVESVMGDNFTALQFTYFNRAGTAITPDTVANRSQVWRVNVRVVGQTAQNLSDGTRPTFAMTLPTFPRNMGVD